MEEIKKEEMVKEEPVMKVDNEGIPYQEIKLNLEKLREENKFIKEELIKLKDTQVIVNPVEEKAYEVNEKLWKEIF